MARREMRWFRYLCEGHKRSGTPCDGMVMVTAIDEYLADAKVQDEYDWHITSPSNRGAGIMLCDAPHREDR